ncbi:MAG: hypothetical protein Kow0020_03860 [Wenzhouxiangellaceae bacterium]
MDSNHWSKMRYEAHRRRANHGNPASHGDRPTGRARATGPEPAGSIPASRVTAGRSNGLARHAWRTLVVLALLASTAVWAQFQIDWHSIDGGGELQMEDAGQQWQLSGTVGQWDDTALLELSGGSWTLTGGFWPANIGQTDLLFRDGFEGG